MAIAGTSGDAMAGQTISPDFHKEFSSLLDERSVAANDHLHRLLACLRHYKFTYSVEQIPTKYIMPHAANRGGLLLSPHNVHRLGARIASVGADLRHCVSGRGRGKVVKITQPPICSDWFLCWSD